MLFEALSNLAFNTTRVGHPNFSGHSVPVSRYPHSKEFLPDTKAKPALFQLKAIPPCPITTYPLQLSSQPFQVLEGLPKASFFPS